MKQDKDELLPCPWCNKTDNLVIDCPANLKNPWYSIRCVGCDVEMDQIVDTKKEIIELWNKRL